MDPYNVHDIEVARQHREAEARYVSPRGGHLARATERAGQAVSRTARRIWDPAVDRHLDEADRTAPAEADRDQLVEYTSIPMTVAAWASVAAYGLLMGVVAFVWGAR